MQPDDDFFKHLGTLNNFQAVQKAYSNYKNSPNNDSFLMNGALRSGVNLSDFTSQIDLLNCIFRAKNNTSLILYRMTSDAEFTPNGVAIALKKPFRYPAFLSTTRNPDILCRFVPASGVPTILKINCPIGTGMALMEGGNNSSNEDEILLQSYTQYKISCANEISDASLIKKYVGNHNYSKHQLVYEIEMDITDNSHNLKNVSPNDFYKF